MAERIGGSEVFTLKNAFAGMYEVQKLYSKVEKPSDRKKIMDLYAIRRTAEKAARKDSTGKSSFAAKIANIDGCELVVKAIIKRSPGDPVKKLATIFNKATCTSAEHKKSIIEKLKESKRAPFLLRVLKKALAIQPT